MAALATSSPMTSPATPGPSWPGGPAVASMRKVAELESEAQVKLMAWSSKIDLLAVAFSTGVVSIYRFNKQAIWHASPPSESAVATSITWRPDGKFVAVGYSSGVICIYSIESSDAVHSSVVDGCASSLYWFQCQDSEERREEKAKKRDGPLTKSEYWRFMTKFPPLSKAYSSSFNSESECLEVQKLSDDGNESLLVCGTNQGQLSMYMNGYLLCARINVREFTSDCCEIMDAILSTDLSTLSIFVTTPAECASRQLKLIVLAVPPLVAMCFDEMEMTSKYFSILHGIMTYLSDTLNHIEEAWEGIVLEMDTKLEMYSNKLPEQGEMATEFLELLMLGSASPELQQFLQNELTEKGLKKLESSVEASCNNVRRLILKYLHSVSESLNYFLAEMYGHVKASKKLHVLGVTADNVSKAQCRAASFWSKGLELQQVVDESRNRFKMFFRWLQGQIISLNEEAIPEDLVKFSQRDIRYIAEFLASFDFEDEVGGELNQSGRDHSSSLRSDHVSHRYLEKVGQYLKNAPLTQPVDRRRSPWHNFLQNNPDLLDIDVIVKVNPRSSLRQEREQVESAVQDIFGKMNTDMTGQCQLLCQLHVPSDGLATPDASSLCCRQFECPESAGKILGVIAEKHPGNQMLYYEISSSKQQPHFLKAAWITLNSDPKPSSPVMLVDVHFYNSETVSLLLENATSDETKQRVMQFPLANVERFLKPLASSSLQTSVLLPSKQNLLSKNIFTLVDQTCHREIDTLAIQFAVSGPRRVAAFLFKSANKIRIYDMEVEEDDDEDDETHGNSGLSSSDLNTSS